MAKTDPNETPVTFNDEPTTDPQPSSDPQASSDAPPETVDGKVLDASAGDVPPPAPTIPTGQTAEVETDASGNIASSGLTDALNRLRVGGGTVPGTDAVIVGATPSASPRPLTSISEIAENAGLPAEAVIGDHGGTLEVFASAQEAMDAGAAVLDRAVPHISPILASEPAILKNGPKG